MTGRVDTSGMHDADAVVFDAAGIVTPLHHAMISASFSLGFNRVTASNVAEILFRIRTATRNGMEFAYDGAGYAYVPSADDVVRYIGFRTNANVLSDAAFRRMIADDVMRDVKRETQRSVLQHVDGHTNRCARQHVESYTNACVGRVWDGTDYVDCDCECHDTNNSNTDK